MTRDLQPAEAASLAAFLDRAADQLVTGQSVEIVVLGLRQAARRLRGNRDGAHLAMLGELIALEAGADVTIGLPRPAGGGS